MAGNAKPGKPSATACPPRSPGSIRLGTNACRSSRSADSGSCHPARVHADARSARRVAEPPYGDPPDATAPVRIATPLRLARSTPRPGLPDHPGQGPDPGVLADLGATLAR